MFLRLLLIANIIYATINKAIRVMRIKQKAIGTQMSINGSDNVTMMIFLPILNFLPSIFVGFKDNTRAMTCILWLLFNNQTFSERVKIELVSVK